MKTLISSRRLLTVSSTVLFLRFLLTLVEHLPARAIAGNASKKSCESFKIPVTVSSTNLIYAPPHFQTDFDVADFVDTISSRSAPPASAVFAEVANLTATYTISATFCKPGRGLPSKDTVILATHGLNFGRSYWDLSIDPETYSFVDFAINLGYSVFYYDRLGVADSQTVSGYVAQLSNQAAILVELASMIKEGKICQGSGPLPSKLVLVGHSFGSSITLAGTALLPTLPDAVVLTGFSLNATAANGNGFLEFIQPRIAAKQRPAQWGHLDTGYVTGVDLYSNVGVFLKAPYYETDVAEFAEANKQPFAVAEALTGGIPPPPFNFTGPVLIMTGKYDFIFCTSDCDGGVLDNPLGLVFGASKAFKAVSYPKAGHGINLHTTAPDVYGQIFDFLQANGL